MLQQAIRDETELIQSSAVTFTGHVWEGMWQNTSKHARFASLRKGVKHCRFHSSLCLSQANRGEVFLWILSRIFQHLRGGGGGGGGDGTILTFVDRLTKQAHFVPTKGSINASGTADLYIENVFRLHGLSQSILSDRDPRFTSDLYKAIFEKLGVHLSFSTSHHPQQTDRLKGHIAQLSRFYVRQRTIDNQIGRIYFQPVSLPSTTWCRRVPVKRHFLLTTDITHLVS